KDATAKQRQLMEKEEGAFKQKVIKAGMKANSLTTEEKKPFVETTAKVYPMFEKDLGKDLMEIIKKVQK
nr:C4-dicarboxylate ABC transporter substrate-binding protein [Synergistaceae bacterium]